MNNFSRLIILFLAIGIIAIITTSPIETYAAGKTVIQNKIIKDFYPVPSDVLDETWRYVGGADGENIRFIREAAKRFNFHPVDVAIVLMADSASRQVWPVGVPTEIPYGFIQSPTGMCQIPPGMAVAENLIGGGLIVPGARHRFKTYKETVLKPKEGVDYWFQSLVDDAYEQMKWPQVNISVAAKYMRRVANAAYYLKYPDARESIKLDIKDEIVPPNIRWADEFDWGKLKKYLRDQRLWDLSYDFDIDQFAPSEKRLSELNMMILYSEYRTAPPFDGSWFFEGMYLVREVQRWFESNPEIMKKLEPLDGKMIRYTDMPEDYSYYQDQQGTQNPQGGEVIDSDEKNSDSESNKDSDEKPKKGTRKPRGK